MSPVKNIKVDQSILELENDQSLTPIPSVCEQGSRESPREFAARDRTMRPQALVPKLERSVSPTVANGVSPLPLLHPQLSHTFCEAIGMFE